MKSIVVSDETFQYFVRVKAHILLNNTSPFIDNKITSDTALKFLIDTYLMFDTVSLEDKKF